MNEEVDKILVEILHMKADIIIGKNLPKHAQEIKKIVPIIFQKAFENAVKGEKYSSLLDVARLFIEMLQDITAVLNERND